jgi:ABC-type branched-subunit amino acid transport system substrate-binding protein
MPECRRSSGVRVVALGLTLSWLVTACSSGDGGDDEAEADLDDPLVVLDRVGNANPSCRGEADGVLQIGGLLAQTGEFGEVLGAPQVAGANLAVADINAAGGVLGQQVVLEQLDSGQTPQQARTQVGTHLRNGVDAILGASTSQISEDVIGPIVEACKIMFSPSNTGPGFTTVEDDDLYFRTAATDILQGRVLANLAIEDGVTSAAIVARDDLYGAGLARFITEPFEDAGGRVVVDRAYDPEATDFAEDVTEVVERDPQALFLVGFAESAEILLQLVEEGFTPESKRIYLVEGNMTTSFAEAVPEEGTLAGIRGTIPGAQVSTEFRFRLLGQNPDLPSFTFGAEAYDAVVVTALAAAVAETDQSDEVARQINGVTREGTKCGSYGECLLLLQSGDDIDYDGQSGALDFARPGEPTAANFGVYPWTDTNTIDHQAVEYYPVAL